MIVIMRGCSTDLAIDPCPCIIKNSHRAHPSNIDGGQDIKCPPPHPKGFESYPSIGRFPLTFYLILIETFLGSQGSRHELKSSNSHRKKSRRTYTTTNSRNNETQQTKRNPKPSRLMVFCRLSSNSCQSGDKKDDRFFLHYYY